MRCTVSIGCVGVLQAFGRGCFLLLLMLVFCAPGGAVLLCAFG